MQSNDTKLRILLVGKITQGAIDWRIAPPVIPDEAPPEGELQRLIEEGEDTEDYENYLLDMDWLRRGC